MTKINERIRLALSTWRAAHPNDRRARGIYLGRNEYKELQAYAKDTADFLVPDGNMVTDSTRVEFGGTPVFEVNADNHLHVA